MIVYFDTSALVKRYVSEVGSQEVEALFMRAEKIGISLIGRAEVAAALAKTVRIKALRADQANQALSVFRSEWPIFVRLQVTETLIARADALAWEYGLRGYDAVHLASAVSWQEHIGESITLATFDQQLWKAGQSAGLAVWPIDLLSA